MVSEKSGSDPSTQRASEDLLIDDVTGNSDNDLAKRPDALQNDATENDGTPAPDETVDQGESMMLDDVEVSTEAETHDVAKDAQFQEDGTNGWCPGVADLGNGAVVEKTESDGPGTSSVTERGEECGTRVDSENISYGGEGVSWQPLGEESEEYTTHKEVDTIHNEDEGHLPEGSQERTACKDIDNIDDEEKESFWQCHLEAYMDAENIDNEDEGELWHHKIECSEKSTTHKDIKDFEMKEDPAHCHPSEECTMYVDGKNIPYEEERPSKQADVDDTIENTQVILDIPFPTLASLWLSKSIWLAPNCIHSSFKVCTRPRLCCVMCPTCLKVR